MILITKWKKQRDCFHHDRIRARISNAPVSWIKEQLIDTGMRKIFWCTHCEKVWFT